MKCNTLLLQCIMTTFVLLLARANNDNENASSDGQIRRLRGLAGYTMSGFRDLDYHGEDESSQHRHLGPKKPPATKTTKAPSIKVTKPPSVKSTKAPSVKSTKAPSMKSTKAPSMKSTKAPSMKSTKAPGSKSTKAPKSGLAVRARQIRQESESRQGPFTW